MIGEFDPYIINGSVYSPLIGIAIGIVGYNRLNRLFRIMFWLLFVSFSFDITTSYVIKGGNYYLIVLYFLIFANTCNYILWMSIRNKSLWKLLSYLTINCSIISESVITKMEFFNSTSLSMMSIVLILESIYNFYIIYSEEKIQSLEKLGYFWVIIGILIYSSGALFSFTLANEIFSTSLSWMFHNIANILKNLFFGFAILIHLKHKVS